MSNFITKIKFKDETVEIRFNEMVKTTEKETVVKCKDVPHPDFKMSFYELIEEVYKILELPSEWKRGKISVKSVTFSQSEKTWVEGAVLSGIVNLEKSNSPFCFKTPYLPFSQYSETSEQPIMPKSTIDKLNKLKAEAQLYLSGKCAQQSINFDNQS